VRAPSINGSVAALRFFFTVTLDRPEMARRCSVGADHLQDQTVGRPSPPISRSASPSSPSHGRPQEKITLLPKRRRPLNVAHGSARFAKFNRARGNFIGTFSALCLFSAAWPSAAERRFMA
jgi:hypothetical protein